jgi:hypothetical protein
VLDITDDLRPREYYAIAGSTTAGLVTGALVPGPYQFKLRAPLGIKSLTVTGPYFAGGGTTTARVRLLVRNGSPITFTRNGNGLDNDAELQLTPTVANGTMTGRADLAVPCGSEVYFTIANSSGRDRTMFNMKFSYEQADTCPGPPPPPDPIIIGAPSSELGSVVAKGCGCDAPGAVPFALLALALNWCRGRRRW